MAESSTKSTQAKSNVQPGAKRKPALARVIADPALYRKHWGQNQGDFWARFGSTQSAGSRYETGRNLPQSVRLLIALEMAGVISPKDLARANDRLKKSSK